jgi:hypothetical protein
MSTLMDQARNRVPRFAEAAVERARLTVVPRPLVGRSGRAARVPFVTLVSLLLVSGVAGLLFFNTSMQQASFRATAMEHRAQLLGAERQALQMQLDSLSNPQQIALQARRMGMVPPATPAFIRLEDGKVLGTPLPARRDEVFRVTPLPTRKPVGLARPPIVVQQSPTAHQPARGGAATGTEAGATGTKKSRTHSTERQGSPR